MLTDEQIAEGRRLQEAVYVNDINTTTFDSAIIEYKRWLFLYERTLLEAAAENARLRKACEAAATALADAHEESNKFRNGYYKVENEVCQTLGKALGYPWFKDDQKNFPGATEADGVCVGEHVAESIAAEAADVITRLQSKCIRECPF